LIRIAHDSLESCIKSHNLKNNFSSEADKFTITSEGQDKTVTKEEFVNSKMAQFYHDMCKMLEVTKNQARNPGYERNLITHEIKNYAELVEGPYKDVVLSTIKEAVHKVIFFKILF
jgi:hypothetical protein